jgi:hypothetical protein
LVLVFEGWSQWTRGLRRRSSAARLLRLWVRNPPGTWTFVCCACCVLSGRGLSDGLITRPEESYRLWRVIVCDLENFENEEDKARYRAVKIQPQWVVTAGKQTNRQTNLYSTARPVGTHFPDGSEVFFSNMKATNLPSKSLPLRYSLYHTNRNPTV